MSHQPEPLTPAAILKLEGDELSAAVVIALGGEWRTNKTGDRTLYFNDGIVGWPESVGFVWWIDRYRYAESWNAAGELLEQVIAAGDAGFIALCRAMYVNPEAKLLNLVAFEAVKLLMPRLKVDTPARAFLLLTLNPQA